ncbi:hypothetical protein [Halarchaeum sp. P4]|uniref:hypothetical protein n=1 Tax=Halarchaeum sp. P4 TaxID=3421639 RepID=UPI003EB920EF
MSDDRPHPIADATTIRGFLAQRPEVLLLSLTVLGYDLAVQLANRFVAVHMLDMGASAVAVGAFASLGYLVAVLYPFLGDGLPDAANDRAVVAVTGTLSACGLLFWVGAPHVGATTTTIDGFPAWVWAFVGMFVLHAWKVRGVGAAFAEVKRRVPYEPLVTGVDTTERLRRLGVVVAALPLVVLFVSVPFTPGFYVLVATAAALGLVVTVVQLVLRYHDERGPPPSFRGSATIRADVRSLPRKAFALLCGDALVEFSFGMVHVFLVLFVVNDLALEAAVLGVSLPPAATFAVLLAVEGFVALAAVVPGEELAAEFGARPTVVAGLVAGVAFPALLAFAPPVFPAVAALFALFGVRFIAVPARGEVLADLGEESVASYRTARNVAVVPSAAVGGVLYALAPSFVFVAATVVGTVGIALFCGVETLVDAVEARRPTEPRGEPTT